MRIINQLVIQESHLSHDLRQTTNQLLKKVILRIDAQWFKSSNAHNSNVSHYSLI